MTHNTQPNQEIEFSEAFHFSSAVYSADLTKFLAIAKEVAFEAIDPEQRKDKKTTLYPNIMSANLGEDPRLADLVAFLLDFASKILTAQGYDMDTHVTVMNELWVQEHYKYSSMDQHVHDMGAQINGFFFLQAPTDGCRFCIYDPRPGKVQAGIRPKDHTNLSYASNHIVFDVAPGLCMFTNAWLPHSFSRNGSDLPTVFLHINIGVKYVENKVKPAIVI